jgi:hypothetical protein
MSRIVAGMTISLDGFVNDTRGSTAALDSDLIDWRNEERGNSEGPSDGSPRLALRVVGRA